jgi:hypothetical protein
MADHLRPIVGATQKGQRRQAPDCFLSHIPTVIIGMKSLKLRLGLGKVLGVVGLLVSLGLGLWLCTVVVAFGAGLLARPRIDSLLGRWIESLK